MEGKKTVSRKQIGCPAMNGVLYLVATPIGNYDDITYRALRILKEVDIIVYEDHREGQRLLSQYQITPKQVEILNEHNELSASFHILEYLKAGKNVALISDAGTPVFSDPGKVLVKKAIENNIKVVPIPGVSSLLPALTVSGFPVDRFLFYGFLSPKGDKRISELQQLKTEQRTIALMDTPYRLIPVLRDIAKVLGEQRKVCVAFNLTMPDEEVIRGKAKDVYQYCEKNKIKGEFVIVIEPTGKK